MYALLAALLLVAALLAVPLTLTFDVYLRESLRHRVELRWGLGRFGRSEEPLATSRFYGRVRGVGRGRYRLFRSLSLGPRLSP